MKKITIILFLMCCFNFLIAQDTTQKNVTHNYTGSFYKKNYIWGGAMNLAWEELGSNILKGKPIVQSNNIEVINLVNKLNNPPFKKEDLDEKSYYIKSGYGQSTVTTINQESKAKFPKKSFEDLNLRLFDYDIISYAYFLKQVEYLATFTKQEVEFLGSKVKGFYAKNKLQLQNIKVLHYESDNKFMISIKLKDTSDQLILAKGYDITSPTTIVNELNKINFSNLKSLNNNDFFSAPMLHVDYHRDYTTLLGARLANKDFKSYRIEKMFENIKFDMDEKGARVENEAVIVLGKSIEINDSKPRKFILNKPYWIIMKRTNSQNPYFILGINNTELMIK
jgi:hypothetical protein